MGSDLFGRFRQLLEEGGGLAVTIIGLLLLYILILVVLRKRFLMIGTFILALTFTGSVIPGVDAGSTLFRWAVMFAVAATCVFGISSPGWPAILLGMVSLLCMLWGFAGPIPLISTQKAVLFAVMVLPMGAAIANHLQTMEDIKRFLRMFFWAAVPYILISLASIPRLREGARFGGGTRAVGVFGMTGGFLLPFTLWGAVTEESRFSKWWCRIAFISISLITVLSAVRTGTFAGFIACLPILARFNPRKIVLVSLVVLLSAGVIYGSFLLFPGQAFFVKQRFITTDVSGRIDIWRISLEGCLESPWTGRGMGSASEVRMGGSFHNAYLTVWYEGGIICLLLFGLAYLGMVRRGLWLVLASKDKETKDIARLLLGLALGCIAAGMFEDSIFSPSNMPSFMGLTVSVLTTRLIILARQRRYAPEELGGYPPLSVYPETTYLPSPAFRPHG